METFLLMSFSEKVLSLILYFMCHLLRLLVEELNMIAGLLPWLLVPPGRELMVFLEEIWREEVLSKTKVRASSGLSL